MSQAEYIPNSGLLGSLAMVAQRGAARKLRGKAEGREADAMRRAAEASLGAEDQKAEREYAREQKVSEKERGRRSMLAQQMGLNRREALEFVETGKVPQAVRGVPMMTNQGLVNVNPYTNEYEPVSPQGSGSVEVNGDVPPEVAAAIKANPDAFDAGQRIDVAGKTFNPGAQAPLMPYKDPEAAARQAAADARADESMGLARRSADRADKALEVQQQAARNKPVTEDQSKSAGYALRMERALDSITQSASKDPKANRPGFGVAALDMLPDAAGNYLKSPERQNIEAAQLDALDAALTLNTGAAYTKEQLFGLRKSYFPQPGDDESTVAAKQERLQGLIETARIRARNAYPSGDKPADSGGASPQAGNDQARSSAIPLSPQEQRELEALRKRFGK